jgi:hypothetical protein
MNIPQIIFSGAVIAVFLWVAWTQIKSSVQKAIVLQVGPAGVSSYYLHDKIIRWADLHDIQINAAAYAGKGANNVNFVLKVILIPRENSPSWVAIQRKWIFWHRNRIRILLTALPTEEQVQAALALRATFAYYGGERAARLMLGVRQVQMEKTFQALDIASWIGNVSWDTATWLGGKQLPEIPQHLDFSLPPRDNPDAPPLPRS